MYARRVDTFTLSDRVQWAIALDVGVAVKIQDPRLGRHSIGFQGILTWIPSLAFAEIICNNNNAVLYYIITLCSSSLFIFSTIIIIFIVIFQLLYSLFQ